MQHCNLSKHDDNHSISDVPLLDWYAVVLFGSCPIAFVRFDRFPWASSKMYISSFSLDFSTRSCVFIFLRYNDFGFRFHGQYDLFTLLFLFFLFVDTFSTGPRRTIPFFVTLVVSMRRSTFLSDVVLSFDTFGTRRPSLGSYAFDCSVLEVLVVLITSARPRTGGRLLFFFFPRSTAVSLFQSSPPTYSNPSNTLSLGEHSDGYDVESPSSNSFSLSSLNFFFETDFFQFFLSP